MPTQVILLERIENLGKMGDVVRVKPGYARNYLLPQKKALRASQENIAYFESQKSHLEAENEKARKEAEKRSKKVDGVKLALIRQASETGQLFGSVAARDIADQLTAETGEKILRSMVSINQNFKEVGLFPVSIMLHPEVKVNITINIARTMEEAEIQEKTGKALVADDNRKDAKPQPQATDEQQLEGLLDDNALQAQKERQLAEAEEAAEEQKHAEERAAKKAKKPKKAAKSEDVAAEDASADEDDAE
jgi:large subunit ribosomal protein L9